MDATVRTVTTDDVRNACDLFAKTYEQSGGVDGRVSIEVDPRVAHDTEKTIASRPPNCGRSSTGPTC